MIEQRIQTKVKNATVTLLKKGGQGVLVRNNLILTAAHCIGFSFKREMFWDNSIIEEIETIKGKIKVAPLAIEPVSDIAVLSSVDDQASEDFYNEANAFEEFCSSTKPIPLCSQTFVKQFEKFIVYVYTHKKTWIKGEAIQGSHKKYSPAIWVETEKIIEGGTSGSPIINERGQLVAIVSNTSFSEGQRDKFGGSHPFVHHALPIWILKEISQRK
jgi:hypothetical protein